MKNNTVVIAPKSNKASREKLANLMSAQGVSTAPVQHPTQALARLMQAYVGGQIRDDIATQEQTRKTSARETLQDALAAYRGDTTTPMSAQTVDLPESRPQVANLDVTTPGTGSDRAALMQVLQGNPDMADMANKSELATILAGNTDYKIPSGYRKSANGGIEQIPGWVNSSRYKQVSYVDEQGNTQNAVIDVAQLQNSQAATPMGGQAQPGQPSVGPNGMINMGTKKEVVRTPESGGKVALLQQGMRDVAEANQLLFTQDGKFNRINAMNAWLNTPYTDGRDIRGRYKTALAGKIYVTTGAVASPDELADNLDAFMPGPFDNDVTAQDKAVRLNQFLKTALVRIDESGRLVPKDAELRGWMQNSLQKSREYNSKPVGTAEKPATPKTADDFNALKPGDYFINLDGKMYKK